MAHLSKLPRTKPPQKRRPGASGASVSEAEFRRLAESGQVDPLEALTERQAQLMVEQALGSAPLEAARAAGYASATQGPAQGRWARTKSADLAKRLASKFERNVRQDPLLYGPMRRTLHRHGITLDWLIRKCLKPALQAEDVKLMRTGSAQTGDDRIERHKVPAWDPRLRALDMAFNLRGDYPQAATRVELGGAGGGEITLNVRRVE